MTARLYKRQARLLFGTQVSDGIAGFTLESNGSTGLRVVFTITRSTEVKANRGKIEIYNLSAETRGKMDGQGARRVVLEAGYEETLGALLCADRVQVRHRQQGTEWVSTIEAGDGLKALNSYARGSYAKGTTARAILDDLKAQAVAATGLPLALRISASAESAMAAKVYGKGTSFTGDIRVSGALNRICAEAGCRVSIQDCALQVLLRTEAAAGVAVLLSPSTGLVGTPERTTERDDAGRVKAHYLKGTALLDARLAPNRQVRVESKSESGTILLTRVDHTGDTHGPGQSWTTRWEGKLL